MKIKCKQIDLFRYWFSANIHLKLQWNKTKMQKFYISLLIILIACLVIIFSYWWNTFVLRILHNLLCIGMGNGHSPQVNSCRWYFLLDGLSLGLWTLLCLVICSNKNFIRRWRAWLVQFWLALNFVFDAAIKLDRTTAVRQADRSDPLSSYKR